MPSKYFLKLAGIFDPADQAAYRAGMIELDILYAFYMNLRERVLRVLIALGTQAPPIFEQTNTGVFSTGNLKIPASEKQAPAHRAAPETADGGEPSTLTASEAYHQAFLEAVDQQLRQGAQT